MENRELHKLLKNLIGNYFGSVFSKKNEIVLKNNKFYVFNNSAPPHTGHFLSLYICGNNVYVFDSLGKNDIGKSDIICQNCPKFIYLNNTQIQSNYSIICAIYCIFYI